MDPFIFNSIDHNEELLFCVARGEKAISELIPSAAVPNDSILVIINVRLIVSYLCPLCFCTIMMG